MAHLIRAGNLHTPCKSLNITQIQDLHQFRISLPCTISEKLLRQALIAVVNIGFPLMASVIIEADAHGNRATFTFELRISDHDHPPLSASS